MVHRSSNSSLVEEAAAATSELLVCTILNGGRVVVEEFPRVERTEIVRLGEEESDEDEEEEDEEEDRDEDEDEEELKTANVELFSACAAGSKAECLSDRQNVQLQLDKNQNQNQRRSSGRFSLFNWFKKGVNSTVQIDDISNQKESAFGCNNKRCKNRELQSVIYSSSGSVDTTCSTATVHSFTFRSGPEIIDKRIRGRLKNFRKHLSADDFAADPQLRRSRVVSQFDSEPSIDRDYFSVYKNEGNEKFSSTSGAVKKKKKADKKYETIIIARSDKNLNDNKEEKLNQLENYYRSLPTAGKTADLTKNKKRNVHVRGKRRAPKPPIKFELFEEKTNTAAKRKRQAPKPPVLEKFPVLTLETNKCELGISGTSKNSENRNNISPIINDTLKLEGGILLPNKYVEKSSLDMSNAVKTEGLENGVKKLNPSISCNTTNTVVPRPWYKRSNTTLSERDICGSFRREVLKIPATLSKSSKDKGGRFSFHHEPAGTAENLSNESGANSAEFNSTDKSFSRLNHLFGRSDAFKTKKDEKRKSNLSILTNISELDREAAAIVQEEQARNQAALARSSLSSSSSSSFPLAENEAMKTTSGDIISEIVSSSIEPSQRRGTRALISKFNAISNITKVTVNATFFTKSSGSQSSAKIDVVRAGEARKNRNDRNLVTKRLVCDGTERVNETTAADISSINFFRRLEAEADINNFNSGTAAAAIAAPGWEEKIKRYFPEKGGGGNRNRKEEFISSNNPVVVSKGDDIGKSYFAKQRDFQIHDNRNRDKIEHLSRADLKEMLIEMKHSLPKRPKPKSSGKSLPMNNERSLNPQKKIQSELIDGKLLASKSTGIGKLDIRYSKNGGKPVELLKNEMENSTSSVIDKTKTKVSSGVQTSANIRRVEPLQPTRDRERQRVVVDNSRYKYAVKKSEDTIYTMKGKKSSGNSAGGLARNTFQLIRPRDFACIEALKTEKVGLEGAVRGSQNTYMNVIEDSIYANAVINPGIIIGEDKFMKKLETESINKIEEVNNDDDKNIGNNSAGKFLQNYNAGFKIEDSDTRKTEIDSRILGGVGDEKSNVTETNMNTMAINRLLRKLEGAIASGQHQQAAGLAKELAQLKIHCSVVRQRSGNIKAADFINVDMYIEDKLAHQGPIPLQLSLNMTVAELKNKVFAEFEIPANVQRWIIGKNLADNDDFTINELKAVDKSSIFLYLVAPDLQNDECTRVDKPAVKEEETVEVPVDEERHEIVPILEEEAEVIPSEEPTVEELKIQRYEHLMSLENSDVIPNSVPIECPICFAPYGPCEGVILRDCLHMFCRTCIANTILYCEEAEVKCPFRDSEYTCESTLQEREIKALVTPEVYEQHLAKSVSQAENNAGNNAFHCKTPDCRGWCIYDDNVNVFLCPVCGVNNCLTCQAIHMEKNCREYQDEIRLLKETDQETKRTAAVLEEMVESGEALACPTCAVVLMKKWGCDWLRCSMCKTEICWVTRGPRWGPAGKGDTSGGCKCGENGVKCHPRCNYCH